jgi:Na+/H+ antiporter NhaC
MTTDETTRTVKEPSLLTALIPMLALIALIAGSLLVFGLDALDGPIQVALILACMCAALVALRLGYRWSDVQEVGRVAMGTITSAIFILLAVGALIGTWNLSGTIPTLVYYGIQVLSPGWYYLATAVICGVIALSIGSSWSRLCLLPDPGGARTTTGPDGRHGGRAGQAGPDLLDHPAQPAATGTADLHVGAEGACLAVVAHRSPVRRPDGTTHPTRGGLAVRRAGETLNPLEALKAGWLAMANGFEINSGIPDIDQLLSRGGMDSMLFTLIIGAVTFGTLVDVLYLPFAIFCIASPLLSVIYGITGFKIRRIEPVTEERV